MKSPPIIEEAGILLRKPLSLVPEDMEMHIIELDGIRFDLAEQKANTLQLLYEKRKQALWPRDMDKKLTELDRKIRLDGDLASIERDYQFLGLIWEMVDQRLKFMETHLENQSH